MVWLTLSHLPNPREACSMDHYIRNRPPRNLWAFILATFVLLMPMLNLQAAEIASPRKQQCNINHGPCTKELKSCTVTLEISPRPVTAMQDLSFTVILSGDCGHGAPFVDLSMPDMVMGDNRVLLQAMKQGVYKGTGVIVRCPSGRRTWQATVTVPKCGSVDFIFDAIY